MEIAPQSSKIFALYNFYRIIIGLLLLGLTFSQKAVVETQRFPDLFQTAALFYLLLNIAFVGINKLMLSTTPKQIFSVLSFDILFIHGLFYLGAGAAGGLSNFVIITVAAGNIMIRGRIGLSFAAMASILSLFVEMERYLANLSGVGDIARAGLMGSLYFATAYIVQNLSLRISQSELLASQRQQDLIELEQLNHEIIQSMRTGIIVCDEHYHIKTLNQACKDLINLDQDEPLPQVLIDRIQLWREQPDMRTTPFQIHQDKPMVQANFSHLKKDLGSDVIIFLDDTRLMTQQAQQLKLASLGRLTASIAHEVRNPLGAISHATQLLAESEQLDAADRKMTDIIQRHSQRVNMIIENTLQLSRRSEPKAQEIALEDWLNRLVDDYQTHQNVNAKLALTVNANQAHARFDPDQIEQVVVNLMNNGVRHGTQLNPDAMLTIELNETEDGEQAYIDVIDQGEGVPDENVEHLFEPFFTTETQGTGLGLYLSREICEANQARLDYMGHTDAGTCFRLTFAHHKRIV